MLEEEGAASIGTEEERLGQEESSHLTVEEELLDSRRLREVEGNLGDREEVQ